MSEPWTFGRVERPEVEIVERDPDIPFQLIGYRVERHEHAEGCAPECPEEHEHVEGCPADCATPALYAGEEITFDFTARGDPPQGSTMRMIANADVRGNADLRSLGRWIQACLVPEDQDRWWDTLDDPDVHFTAEAVKDLAVRLIERYGGRPTQSRSERRAGVRHSGRTSAPALPATASR